VSNYSKPLPFLLFQILPCADLLERIGRWQRRCITLPSVALEIAVNVLLTSHFHVPDPDGKPLPPLPPYDHDHEPASPLYSGPDEDDQEYYEATEMSGYPETYRPALSTITELTERSDYSRPWSSARGTAMSGYTDSRSSITEYGIEIIDCGKAAFNS